MAINSIKLQRLLYFAQGWFLAMYERPLFDEKIEAFRYGPVCIDIREQFLQYGTGNISSTGAADHCDDLLPVVAFLSVIWEVYGKKFNLVQLSRLANDEEGPWYKTIAENPGRKHLNVSEELMKIYFKSKIAN